jgi:co-chaperonin GroES (HSP10)
MVRLDIKVGDTILMGRFKNKKVTVKTISFDEHGMPLVNGKPICAFRYQKD